MRARTSFRSIAGALLLTAATVSGQTPRRVPAAPVPLPNSRFAAANHGTWVQGPGTYIVTVCEAGCTINGPSGKAIDLFFEAWGAGGGGGGGSKFTTAGGGGGGGGYATANRSVTIPLNGIKTYQVTVGSGGIPGSLQYANVSEGGDGGGSEITGELSAPGGKGAGPQQLGGGGVGGAGGGTLPGQGGIPGIGQAGGVGADPNTCNGGGGGAGGIGGGPGAINNGGTGGHGSYQHRVIPGRSCTAHGQGYGRTAGDAGGNGRIKITW